LVLGGGSYIGLGFSPVILGVSELLGVKLCLGVGLDRERAQDLLQGTSTNQKEHVNYDFLQ